MGILAFDLGGTHLRAAYAMADGKLRNVRKTRVSNFLSGDDTDTVWSKIVDDMAQYVDRVDDDIAPTAPLVLSFPGPIQGRRQILSAPTVVGSVNSNPDLAGQIEKATGHPAFLINDVSAAAWYLSETEKENRFLVLTVSSGIGSKTFDVDHPSGVIDDLPFAGEIGHVQIDDSPEAPICDCGGTGHLGAIASGRGIERAARRWACADPTDFGGSACALNLKGSATTLTNEAHLVPAAAQGDRWALDIIRSCTRPLARTVLTAMVSGGLEKVVVIGGFALALGPVYLDILRVEMARCTDYALLPQIGKRVVLGQLEDEACLQGAAVYGLKHLEVRQ